MNNDRLIPSMPLDYKDYYKNKNIDELLKIKSELEDNINKSSIPNEDIVGEGIKNQGFKEKLEYVNILIEYNEKYNNYSVEELKNMIKETEELLKVDTYSNADVLVDENKLQEDVELIYFLLKKILKEKENIDIKDKFSKIMIDSIISNHTMEFASKPPKYELPRYMFLFIYENQYYLVSFLSKHVMNYPNNNLTNNEDEDTHKVLIFKIDDNTSAILNIDDFISKYDIRIDNEKDINLDSIELPIKLNEIHLIFDEIFADKNNINLDKYNTEYLPIVIKYLSEDKKKIVSNLPIKETSTGFIRKYKTDGTEEEIELKIPKLNEKLPFTPEEAKYYSKISSLLDISVMKCKEYSKRISEINATYYYNPIRGGKSIIVSDDGSYLLNMSSALDFEKLLEEYKTGRRNGNFEKTIIKCHSCNKEVEIDFSKYPSNVKTLDTMCPNCKSFIKFGNPNYNSNDDINQSIDSEELNSILDSIFSKLTGDRKIDVPYLDEKLEEYQNHPLSKEIFRELGRKNYELLHKEQKESFDDAYKKDIDNIYKKLSEIEKLIFSENKDYKKAEEMLLDLTNTNGAFDDDELVEYHNFSDVIDFALYTRIYKPQKNIKWLDIPFFTAYSYLSYLYNEQGRYEEGLKAIENTIKWNPMVMSPLFEKCEIYKMKKDLEGFYKETISLYDKIYRASDLAHFYRNLGYYYIELNKLDIAYALYTASLKFEKNNTAYGEMTYINQQLNRKNYDMSAEEGLKLMKEVNINFGPKQENLNMLAELYTSEKELLKNASVEAMLANRIYQFTKDKRFSPFIELIDKPTGCSIIVPRSWKPLSDEKRKVECGEQNMFTVYTDNGSIFQAYHEGKCTKEKFDEIYNLNIRNMIENNKNLNLQVLSEGSLTLQLQQGNKDFKHALTEATSNGKKLRMIHYFTLINGIFADFSINVDPNVDYNDLDKFNNQKNMVDIINALYNIIELKNDNSQNQKSIDNLVNKIDNKIVELTNQELEEIVITYKNNKEIKRAKEYIESLFKNKKTEDPFWISIAKDMLLIVIVNIIEKNGNLKYDDLKDTLNDKTKVIDLCRNGINIGENLEYIKIFENIKKSGNKILDSGYEIIIETLKLITPKVETITHKIKFNDDLCFNIIFPKNLGDLTHPNDTTFKIGNSITIMSAKCSDKSSLKKRANEWLAKSAATNNQVINEKYDKEYFLNDGMIEVIGKGVIKDNKIRYYRFIYGNEHMIIFGYNKNDLLSLVDEAIKSIKYVKDLAKAERDPFESPLNKVINDFSEEEDMSKIINDIVLEEDKEYIDLIVDIVNKIKECPTGKETTISELINYNPEVFFVEPLTQGKVFNYVRKICSRLLITLNENRNEIGGLAYYVKFKKQNILVCPICNKPLMFMAPDGRVLHCGTCNKYYKNNDGEVGEETTTPYVNKDFLY